jgi:cyclopropane fatty-acyl-phospholipid synthase-like methyltransferase
MDNPKFEIQDNQYEFPYHYLAFMDKETPQIKRTLDWGFEYLTYMNVVSAEIKKLKFKNILDVGCGDGYLLNNLETDADKLGIDLSEKAIVFANAFSKDAKFEIKDLFALDTKYDLISLIEVLEHIPNDFVELFMKQVLNLINKDGHFIISVPTTVIPLNKKHYRHYDEQLLSEHIENFSNVELVGEKRVFKMSGLLKFCMRLLNNRIYSINSTYILNRFWKWHLKNNVKADKDTGYHIIRIYKKLG